MPSIWSTLRRLALVALAVGADLGCWRALDADRAVGTGATLPTLVTALAAWCVQAALAWFTVLLVLVVLEPVAGRELTGYVACPPGVRRLLVLLCGAVALGSVTGPVHADALHDQGHDRGHDRPAHTRTARLALDGLALPDRTTDPAARPTTARGPTRAPVARPISELTVRPGDSLWQIARTRLEAAHPDHAPTAAEIDRTWRSWYAANRTRLGDDPDLIQPGVALHAPTDPDHPSRPTEHRR